MVRKKIDPEVKRLVHELLDLAFAAKRAGHDLFVEFFPHVMSLNVRFFDGGWVEDWQTLTKFETIRLDFKSATKKIVDARGWVLRAGVKEGERAPEVLHEIVDLAFDAKKNWWDVFWRFEAHVTWFKGEAYSGGWEFGKKPDFRWLVGVGCDFEDELEDLMAVVKELKKIAS